MVRMTELMPHQQVIFDRLQAAADAPLVVVRAPVGAGMTGALIPFIEQTVATGSVLLVTNSLLLLEQWRMRLADQGLASEVLTSDLALELADGTGLRRPSDIIVTTIQRMTAGPGRQALEHLHPALLVVDGWLSGTKQQATLKTLRATARRTIVLAHPALDPSPSLSDAVVVELSLEELFPTASARSRGQVRLVRVPIDEMALDLALRAADFLGWTGDHARRASRAAIHDALLAVAADAGNDQADGDDEQEHETSLAATPVVTVGRAELAWALVEELESLAQDPLMTALGQTAAELAARHPVWVVTGQRVADAEYVFGSLADAGLDVALSTLTSGTGPPSRSTAMITVITPALLEHLPSSPRPVSLVFSTVPTRVPTQELLRTLIASGAAPEVAAVIGDTDDDPFAFLHMPPRTVPPLDIAPRPGTA